MGQTADHRRWGECLGQQRGTKDQKQDPPVALTQREELCPNLFQLFSIELEEPGKIGILQQGEGDQIGGRRSGQGRCTVECKRPFKCSGLRLHGNTPFVS